MERMLGRYLDPGEVVHHKNGARDDNRIENLELYSSNGRHMAHEWAGRKHSAKTRERMSVSALERWKRERQREANEAAPNR